MKQLKKKHSEQSAQTVLAKEKITGNIGSSIIKVQAAFAKFMDKKVNHLSTKRKKYILYVFCFVSSLNCMYLIISPVVEKKKPNPVQLQNIKYRKYFEESGEATLSETTISKEQYDHIHSFKLYMDSLENDDAGKTIYDSIVANRPKLLDS